RARVSPPRGTSSSSSATGRRSPAARRRSPSTRTASSAVARTRAARATRRGTRNVSTGETFFRLVGISSGMGRFFALVIVAGATLAACEPAQPPPDAVAKTYADLWLKGEYQRMWDLLTDTAKARVGTEGFIDRLPRIAEEMTLKSLDVKVGASSRPLANGSPDTQHAIVPLDITYHTTRVGDVRRTTTLAMLFVGDKEKGVWKIDWTPGAILPNLTPGRLVRMTRLPTTRGRILARDGTELATFTEGAVVGVVPGQVRSQDAMIASLAPVLGLKADDIK